MPYDIVDAYADITRLQETLDALIQHLKEKGIVEQPAEPQGEQDAEQSQQ